ncbi:MAG: hypothetical protein ACREAN_08220, partial [Nitrosopumilaceae archaeon]
AMQQQVADAVPPLLAKAVARKLKRTLFPSWEQRFVKDPSLDLQKFTQICKRSEVLVLAK